MPEPIAEVFAWVVYDPQKRVMGKSLYGAGTAVHEMLASGVTDETIAASEGLFGVWMQDKTLNRYEWNGYTLERLPLATPELLADAARYRYLAKSAQRVGNMDLGLDGCSWAIRFSGTFSQSLDEAIDAARAGEGRRL